ncbi:hypothetical protein [Sphingomonas sp. 3-13AW]|uniref:hypothetical protein n=1 Tax=Sphingomonas sp. 3-13AW TaxID=3050450 RepID=UPI003BB5A39F
MARQFGMRQRNSIGTSLRGCVRDIVDRNHSIDRVEKIISRTSFSTREEVIAYVTPSDSTQKERFAQVAGRLWDAGKIVQPAVDGGEHPEFSGVQIWHLVEPPAPVRPDLF